MGSMGAQILRGPAQDKIGFQRAMGLSLFSCAVYMHANQPMRLQSEL
jgi:hypothetical protein